MGVFQTLMLVETGKCAKEVLDVCSHKTEWRRWIIHMLFQKDDNDTINKKKTIIMNLKSVLAAACVVLCAACNNNESKEQAVANISSGELKIAYVEIDSLMSQYQFCKDYSLLLTKKGENIRATLNQKAKTLDSEAQDFQRKLQNNAFTQERAEQENARLVKMQQDLQALNERLSNEFDAETAKYNNAMRDSIVSFLKSYNASKGYSMILTKAGDNMLLANPALDITKDVVSGLNKRYTPSKELTEANAETKAEEKK